MLDSNSHTYQQELTLNNNSKDCLIPATPQLIKKNTQWQRDLQVEKQKVREKIINGFDNDNSNESSTADEPNSIVVRTDSLMDISDHNIENNQSDNIRSIVITTVPTATHQQVKDEFTLNEDQSRAFHIITSHLDGNSFLKQSKINPLLHLDLEQLQFMFMRSDQKSCSNR